MPQFVKPENTAQSGSDFVANLGEVFGSVLAECRRKADLSQEALAFECGLHPTYVSQIERGLKSPTLRTLWLLAKALDTAPSKVVSEVERRLLR